MVWRYLLAATVAGAAAGPSPLPGAVRRRAGRGRADARRGTGCSAAVDRLVYGDRHDPLRAVTRLGDRVAAAGEADLLPAVLAR